MYFLKLFLVSCSLSVCYSAKILGIFAIPTYSHQSVFQVIYRELSLRGHDVVVVTPNPLNQTTLSNLTEIDVSSLYKHNRWMVDTLSKCKTYVQRQEFLLALEHLLINDLMENEEFKNIYLNAKNESFDLIMVEAFNWLLPAFKRHFNAPVIGVYSLEADLNMYSAMGAIIHPSIYGGLFLDFDYPVPLWRKMTNLLNFGFDKLYYKFIISSRVDAQTRKYLGEGFPSYNELKKEVDLLIFTKNSVMSSVRPLPANVIMVDFIHVQPPKPLPKDLQLILDRSTQGAVYFSLGSTFKSSDLPLAVIDAIIEALSSLPYTVLWKWESDNDPGAKDNVITRKWFPQQDVLAHPNVRAFVMQGGLQSSEEAISRGVPIVGIPILGDQEDNVAILVDLGVGLKLGLQDLSAESIKRSIVEVMENRTYAEKMEKVRSVATDQPMTGLERAIWWTEYVIRHKGAPALRCTLADVPSWEYLMLDVFAALIGIFVVAYVIVKKTLSFTFRVVKRKQKCN